MDARDPPDNRPVPARKEELARGVLPEGCFFWLSFVKSSMRSCGTQLGSFLYRV